MVERSKSVLSNHIERRLSEDATNVARFAQQIGVDRTALYRVAVSETANPGLNITARVLVSSGRDQAFEILHQALPQEMQAQEGQIVFSADDFIAEGNVGEQIRAYRNRKNLVGPDIERLSGIGWEEVLRFERNQKSLRFLNFARLIHALELNPDQTFHVLETAAKD